MYIKICINKAFKQLIPINTTSQNLFAFFFTLLVDKTPKKQKNKRNFKTIAHIAFSLSIKPKFKKFKAYTKDVILIF